MKTFNKSLLAIAVAGLSAVAVADTFTDETPVTGSLAGCEDSLNACALVSAEGLALGDTVIKHNGFSFSPSADIEGIDRILVSVSGAAFTLNSDDEVGIAGDLTFSTADDTVSLASLNEISVLLDTSNQTLSSGDSIELSDVWIDGKGLVAGDEVTVTVTFQEATASGNSFLDIKSVTGSVAEVANQLAVNYSGSATNSASSDIEADDRLSFTNGTSNFLTDSFAFSITDKAVQYNTVTSGNSGGTGNYTLMVAGDFSFLDADGDGEVDGSNSVSGPTKDVTFAEDFQSFTYTASASGINGDGSVFTQTFDFEFDGSTEIPELSANGEVEFGYGTANQAGGEFSEAFAAVRWELEGESGSFKYMPYGDNISQILYITNEGSVDGQITVTGYDDAGNKFGPVILDTVAKAGGVTKVTGAVMDAMVAEGFDGTGPLNLNFSVTGSDLSFYGGYNVGGSDRGYVPDSQ